MDLDMDPTLIYLKKKKKLHISVVMEETLNIFESLRFISEDK